MKKISTHVLTDLKVNTLDDLLADIGLGELMSIVIARRLLGDAEELAEVIAKPIKNCQFVALKESY